MRLVPTDVLGTAFLMGLAALPRAFFGCCVTFCVAFFSCFVPPWSSTISESGECTPAHLGRECYNERDVQVTHITRKDKRQCVKGRCLLQLCS